jgi:hypothetical protein
MPATPDTAYTSRHDHTAALQRHFSDLRDGTHGGVSSRREKQALYTTAVALLDRHARRALDEINADLLLSTGELTATGVRSSVAGELDAVWLLSWPEQRTAGIDPIIIRAYFGAWVSSPAPAGWHRRRLAAERVHGPPGRSRAFARPPCFSSVVRSGRLIDEPETAPIRANQPRTRRALRRRSLSLGLGW